MASALGSNEDGVHTASECGERITGYRKGRKQEERLKATAAGVWSKR